MSIYNEDELIPPKYLNDEFFENALGHHENNTGVEVVNLELSPASMKGDHYASIMFRAKVLYRESPLEPVKMKTLIVKTLPSAGPKLEQLGNSKIFETEIAMYTEALPKISQILAEHGDPVIFAPKVIYHTLQPHKIIVMEDLCDSGYEVLRTRFLNEEEIVAIYRKLAKLHAVSFMLARGEEHNVVTKYREGLFNSSLIFQQELFSGGLRRFIEMLTAFDEFDEYIPKLREIERNVLAKCKSLYCAYQNNEKDEIFVLNHGDFHAKNLMLKYNGNGKMQDFMMVDFQVSVFAPSIIDLTYSSYMMLSCELRQKQDIFQRYYFEQFIETLKLINYQEDMPKFADLKIAAIRHRHFSVYMLCTFLPLIISVLSKKPEDMKGIDTSNVFQSTDSLALFYRNPAYCSEVKKLLPQLLFAGYLD